jgi:hypothetical protein
MIGQCKLCLTAGVELQDSHYLSVGIYRILRDDTEKNPNPWLLTKNATVQTSRQLKAHLLCPGLRTTLSRNGENWRYCKPAIGKNGKIKPDWGDVAVLRTGDVLVESPIHRTLSNTSLPRRSCPFCLKNRTC